MTSALVIGAGIGGIATAAHLAHHGYRVTVFEKNEAPGGRCGHLMLDGHYFDTGPTLFLMPEVYAQTFTELGYSLDDHLDLRRVDPTYHIHFNNGSSLFLSSDLNVMQEQLEAIESGSFSGYLQYLSEGYRHYTLALEKLVNRNFYSLLEYVSFRNLRLLFQLKALAKHYNNMERYFKDPRLKKAFTFQDLYVGLSPYRAPAVFSLLQYTELAHGVWYPLGGMYRLVEALMDIAQREGVEFVYNAPVRQIEASGNRATGVILDGGQQHQADVVVANADLPYIYHDLLPVNGKASQLERKKYSFSAITFFWGVDKPVSQLEPHNLFLADAYRQGFDQIFKDCTMPEEPSFYVHAPTRIDPSLAPEGQDSLTVVVPVGHMLDSMHQDWDAIKERARHLVLQKLGKFGLEDLEHHIKFEVSYTPCDWQSRYNLVKGATHGLSHSLLQMGYLRPRNRHSQYRNLYFVGASTHPGTGLPTVLVSARLVTERILSEIGTPRKALP